MPGPRRVVVVGAGLAAVRLAEELHEQGFDGSLVVVGEEHVPPYDRPPLSKHVLRGEREAPPLLQPDDYARLGVDLRLGTRAVALHADRRELLLEDGSTLAYDALVVATGAAPRHVPDVEGPGVHVLRTAQDAEGLRAAVQEAGRVTIVGGGFIGCEVAASARAMGADVVLLEVLSLPLVRVLGPTVAEEVVRLHRDNGVDVRPATSVLEVHGEGPGRTLVLSDGTTVPGDVVLVGIGVEPRTDWLEGSGLEVDGGVVCGADGRSSVDGVWAVGDVARWWVPSQQAHRRIEHWTNASEQAGVVARNLLGAQEQHDPVAYVWSDQYSTKWQLVGLPAPTDDVTLLAVGPKGDRLLAVYGRDGRLTGALGASAPRPVMKVRQLLAEGSSYDDALAALRP